VRGPTSAEIEGRHLVYNKDVPHGGWVAALYVVSGCGPFLASSYRRVVAFGAVNLVAVTVLAWVAETGLTSLWCAWAAVASVLISGHFRLAHRPHERDRDSLVSAAA
ncbi:MAG: hypothetical protein LC799_12085, partial [Actinobacteria bacterium]|nr:hypothetical protein [Actinomycetota bacterium]